MAEMVEGGCLCGAVRVEARGAPLRVGMCHCLECRKHHGAVFYAAAVFSPQAVIVRGDLRTFRGRGFCPACGSSVLARSGEEVELHLGALDVPDVFAPSYELWVDRRESWLRPVPGAAQYARNRDR